MTQAAIALESPQPIPSPLPAEDCVTKRRCSPLDGLRAIAVFGVMAHHIGFPAASQAWLGVDLFFVLSGFLITTLLLREYRANHRISLVRFWARRLLRLMPAYWLYISVITAVIVAGLPNNYVVVDGWTPRWYVGSLWGYFLNYVPPTGLWTGRWTAGHLWSLCVEEQFYFLWPLTVALFARTRWLVPLSCFLLVLVIGGRNWWPWPWSNFLLYTRGIGILMGAAVAVLISSHPSLILSRVFMRTSWRSVLVMALIVLYAVTVLCCSLEFAARWCLLPFCALFTLLTVSLWYGPRDRISAILSWRPLAYLGEISYGLYLYHMVAQVLVWKLLLPQVTGIPRPVAYCLRTLCFVAITVVVSVFSYRLVERPFVQLKERLR